MRETARSFGPRLKRLFWLCVGGLALTLGAIGTVLPVLPTTPFVILAAFAFGRSSPRLQAWLENSATFGPMIREWRQHGAIAPKYQAMAVTLMAGAFVLSLFLGVKPIVLLIQAVCLSLAALFVLSRPSGPRP